MTITSATLPDNTPVTLRDTLEVHDTVSADYVSNYAYVNASLNLYDGSNVSQLYYTDDTTTPANSSTMYGTFEGYVGEQINIEGVLTAGAAATGNVLGGSSSATADAGNTGRFFIDSLTPDATYTTDSGQNYDTPSPAPEPSQWATLGLTALGLGGLAAAARKRRAASCSE